MLDVSFYYEYKNEMVQIIKSAVRALRHVFTNFIKSAIDRVFISSTFTHGAPRLFLQVHKYPGKYENMKTSCEIW